ncbi:ATP synthase subunit I [Limnohabitans sp. T6-5]|uniref:ATP synthase subunit I n=1 Tax=Limnohabitans sp. T6-5 TaxID=1100724 RepID=UPI000D3BA1FA|nr:ATP synthase subunit I [Limnohabitans sp. T6-5]PUE09520.1 ATP synthase subunit I [Limnohabitans sp. T6-5]
MVKISSNSEQVLDHKLPKTQNTPWDAADTADAGLEPEFKPLTAEEAQAWRNLNPMASPWRVLVLQVLVGCLVAVLTGWVSGQFRLAASVAWGAICVVIPAVVFVRALSRQMRLEQPGAALAGLFVWELVKILLTVALLVVAPKVVFDLSWLALVVGFVVTMKVYWLAMALGWMQRKSALN